MYIVAIPYLPLYPNDDGDMTEPSYSPYSFCYVSKASTLKRARDEADSVTRAIRASRDWRLGPYKIFGGPNKTNHLPTVEAALRDFVPREQF